MPSFAADDNLAAGNIFIVVPILHTIFDILQKYLFSTRYLVAGEL